MTDLLYIPGLWLPVGEAGSLSLKGAGHRDYRMVPCNRFEQLGRVLDLLERNNREPLTLAQIEGAIMGIEMEQAHSTLGASGAKRWMTCPGSVRLSAGRESEDSAYAKEGTFAHEIAARCLSENLDAWELAGEASLEMVEHVQDYLDAIRNDGPAEVFLVEQKFTLADLDGRMFGTADCVTIAGTLLRVYDLKYGAGITVEVEGNPQFLYYAAGALASVGGADVSEIEIVVAQPRKEHPDGHVRRWRISVEQLHEWLEKELLPAVAATDAPDAPLVPGEHCRFCPAAAVCPAQRQQLVTVSAPPAPVEQLPVEDLTRLLAMVPTVRMHIKALEGEAFARLSKGEAVPGWKLVAKKADRVLKDGAEAAAREKWGDGAYETRLRSPAQLEKLKDGKPFVAAWAFKPDTGLTMVPEDDRRLAVKARTAREVFAGVIAPIESS